ncbi:MAG TPA: FAD-dependent oxidoreductase [Rhizomicrobium sp.]
MSERYDAAVIGGGVSGLAAVSLLAKAGLRAVLLEQATTLSGPAGEPALRALDPRLVKELGLARHGLKFSSRDLALAVPRSGGQLTVLSRDRHATARSLAALSPVDVAAFAAFQREFATLARALRRTWWEGAPAAETAARLKPAQHDLLDRLTVTSAACFLAARFESDALKAALAFAAAACGFSPSEPGSALALLWSAAQEMCGLQGAVAVPRGGVGGLVAALSQAAEAAGATLRPGATVSRLTVADDRLAGVELAAGEQIAAPLILSTLSRRRTLEGLAPTARIGLGAAQALRRPSPRTGCATLVFGLNRLPDFGGGLANKRVVIAERLETYEIAYTAARLGQMPREPVLELILPPPQAAAEQLSSRLLLSVSVWPVPLGDAFDRDALARTVGAMIERHIPGFAAASCDVLPPLAAAPSVARLLSGAAERIETPIPGLLLCGDAAEPADAISGRAARQAARLAVLLHRKGGAR